MKTILFKIWKFPQLSETFVVNQMVTAIKLGYNVKILAGEITDITRNANGELFRKYNLAERIILEDYKIPHRRALRFFKAAFLFLENLFLLPKLIRYYNTTTSKGVLPLYEFAFYKRYRGTEIFHIQFGTNKHPLDGLKRCGLLKGKLIISFHGHDLKFPINDVIANNGYYEQLFENAEFLIPNTPFLKEKLIELKAPKDKIVTVPVVVDTDFFKPDEDGNRYLNKIKLITVGRLDELKGQSFGIDVVKVLIEAGREVTYTIVGGGEYFEKLKEKIEDLNLQKFIYLTGPLSQQEIKKMLQASDIFLMTSITNSKGMAESQGLVTAEAQACGLPVIAFDSGGVKYTIKDYKTGFLCPEKDVDCFVNKIQLLIEDVELRKQMSNKAIEFVKKNFSEESIENKWKNLYSI